MATSRAGPTAVVAALDADLGLGQILDAADALGGVGPISWEKGSYQELRPPLAICSQIPPGFLTIDSILKAFGQCGSSVQNYLSTYLGALGFRPRPE